MTSGQHHVTIYVTLLNAWYADDSHKDSVIRRRYHEYSVGS